MIIHFVIYIFVAAIVLCGLLFAVIDLFGRVDYLKTNFPWLEQILERRGAVGVLLLVAIFLLIGVGFELVTKEIPEPVAPPVVNLPFIPAPTINYPNKPTDPARRKTPVNPPVDAPVLTGIRIASQKRVPSDDPKLPYGLAVVVQTDADIAPVALAIICDGPIGKANGGFVAGGAYTMTKQGLADGHPNAFLMEWKSPAWTPSEPIIVNLFRKPRSRFNPSRG